MDDYSGGKRMDVIDDSPIVQVTSRGGPLGEGERGCQSEEEEMGKGFHNDRSGGRALTLGGVDGDVVLFLLRRWCIYTSPQVRQPQTFHGF
jgi:hypothetical protein